MKSKQELPRPTLDNATQIAVNTGRFQHGFFLEGIVYDILPVKGTPFRTVEMCVAGQSAENRSSFQFMYRREGDLDLAELKATLCRQAVRYESTTTARRGTVEIKQTLTILSGQFSGDWCINGGNMLPYIVGEYVAKHGVNPVQYMDHGE